MADPTFSDYLRALFHIESGGNPYSVTGSNRGLAQFGPAEERMYGITDANRHLPEAQAGAVSREYTKNHEVLTKALGREPTFAEHYLTHQQGIGGGPAILSGDPQQPAWQTVRPFYSGYEGRRDRTGTSRSADWWAQKAIMGNVPSDSPLARMSVHDISNGGFASMWQDKFNRRMGLPGNDIANAAAPEQPNVLPGMPQGLLGTAPPSGVLGGTAPSPALAAAPGAAPGAVPGAVAPGVAGLLNDPTADLTDPAKRIAAVRKVMDDEKAAAGDKQSKALMALAQQFMTAGQGQKPQFAQFQPMDTGPFRPLPLNLPPGFGTGRPG